MQDVSKSFQYNVIAFSTGATLAAAVAGIAAYIFVLRRLSGDPKEILSRCRTAIDQIERDLTTSPR